MSVSDSKSEKIAHLMKPHLYREQNISIVYLLNIISNKISSVIVRQLEFVHYMEQMDLKYFLNLKLETIIK